MSDGEQTAFGLGYWMFSHQHHVRWFQSGVLGMVCLVIWGTIAFQGINYLRNRSVDQEVQRSFLATDISFDSIARPEPLRVLTVQVVRHDETHVDAVALLKNPNQVFASHAALGQFTVEGKKQDPIPFFVNPVDSFYLPQLSISSEVNQPEVTFTVLSIDWYRIHGEILQEKWQISEPAYTAVALEQETDLQRQVKFSVYNGSAYDFSNVRVTVVLLDDTEVVGVASTVTGQFESLSSKEYLFTWSQPLSLQAIPEVTIHVDRSS